MSNKNKNNPDIWEPVSIQDLFNMEPPSTSEPSAPKEALDLSSIHFDDKPEPDIRTINYDKVTTVEDIKAILKGLDLAVVYDMASDELKEYLNDGDV